MDIERSQEVLNYSELLTMFGAEELENQLLNDQGAFSVHSHSHFAWAFASASHSFPIRLPCLLLNLHTKLVAFCFVLF